MPNTKRTIAALCASLLALAGCAGTVERPTATRVSAEREAAAETDVLKRDVRLLRSEDFVTRARASESLLAAGESALPALGAAGEALVAVPGDPQVSATRPVLREILGGLPTDRVEAQLAARWPVVRREAAAEVGRRGSWSGVPLLIEGLEDDAVSVRAASASALRRLTNRFFGFEADGDRGSRAVASRRWQTWWAIEGRVRDAESLPGGSG